MVFPGKECIVGNIIHKSYHGTERQIVSGTKHFSAGTKVYCIFMYGGAGHERVRVLVRHRISGRMIDVIMATAFIKNFRLQKIYKQPVLDFLQKHHDPYFWDGMIEHYNSMPTAEIQE